MDEIIYNIKIKDEAFWLLVLFLFTKIHMNIIINFDVEFSVPQGNSCSEKRLRLGRQRHVPLSVFLFFFFPKSLIQKVEKKTPNKQENEVSEPWEFFTSLKKSPYVFSSASIAFSRTPRDNVLKPENYNVSIGVNAFVLFTTEHDFSFVPVSYNKANNDAFLFLQFLKLLSWTII